MNRVGAGVGAGFALRRALSLGRVVETSFNLQNNQKNSRLAARLRARLP